MRQQHLSYRLTRLCMLCALLIGVILSAIQIVIDGVRESERIDERMRHSLAVVRSSAAEAVYNIDDELASRVVAGLRSIEGVVLARVALPDRTLAEAHAVVPSSRFRFLTDAMFESSRRYRLDLKIDSKGPPLGVLEVVLDTSAVGGDFVSRSVVVVLTGLVRALALAALLMSIFYFVLTRPLARLTRRLTQIDPAAPERVSFPIPQGHEHDELGGWVRQVNALLTTIRDNLAARAQAENEADFLRQFDALTELPNRALFHDRLSLALENAQREQRRLAVLYCDADSFQAVNDEHGFAFGDQVLMAMARRLEASRRPGEHVARIAADRFALMFETGQGVDEALRRAETLLAQLQGPIEVAHRQVTLDMRLGVSLFPDDANDAETLTRNAETALAVAKRQGPGAIQFYESRTGDEIRGRRRLRGELEAALGRDELALHYQPQFDALGGHVTGVEALLRWELASSEQVSVQELIGICEDAGQIGALGDWVVRRACRDAARWFLEQPARFRIALNISVLQLDHPGFIEVLNGTLDEYRIPPGLIELELTETAIMKDVDHVIRRLVQIRDRGIQVAVDDFGTGHSSLQYLKSLPINCLKIDQSFVRDVCTDAGDAQIVKAIIGLGQNMKLRIVAEGVEEEDQLRFLQHGGCDEIQGYLLARPMPPDRLMAFLADHAGQSRLIRERGPATTA